MHAHVSHAAYTFTQLPVTPTLSCHRASTIATVSSEDKRRFSLIANLSSESSDGDFLSSRHRKFVPSAKCTRCPSSGENPSHLQCTRETPRCCGIRSLKSTGSARGTGHTHPSLITIRIYSVTNLYLPLRL